jgi:hypothetical protein
MNLTWHLTQQLTPVVQKSCAGLLADVVTTRVYEIQFIISTDNYDSK